jgi:hypothetical protein
MGHDRLLLPLSCLLLSLSAAANAAVRPDPAHTFSTDLFPEFNASTPSASYEDNAKQEAALQNSYQPEVIPEGEKLPIPVRKEASSFAPIPVARAEKNLQESFKPDSTSGLPVTNNFRKRAYIRTFYNTAAMDDGRRIEITVDGTSDNAKARVIEADNTKTLVPDGHYEIHGGKLRRLQNNNFELIDDTSILLSIFKGQVINYLPRWAVAAGEFENFEVPEPPAPEIKPVEAKPAEVKPEETKVEKAPEGEAKENTEGKTEEAPKVEEPAPKP